MESIWSKTCEREKRPALEGDIAADAAVIGGGMAGILTAWKLKEAGVHAVVLEADRTGGGQTQNTTAKITARDVLPHFYGEKGRRDGETVRTGKSGCGGRI